MIKPMLCELRSTPFNDDRYLWEVKYDGIRIVAEGDQGSHFLRSRSGKNKTTMFPELNLETRVPAVLDGELVCYNEEGRLIFRGIQRRANRVHDVVPMSKRYPATYEVFDILMVGGEDLQQSSLEERKKILEQVLVPTDNVRLAPYTSDAVTLFSEAQTNADYFNSTKELLGHKEGIVGKLRHGFYHQGKRDWLKVKTFQSGVFTVCGYTQGTGWRTSTFGALVLGRDTGTGLTYVGSVGTGFDEADLRRIHQEMLAIGSVPCPLGKPPEEAVWIKPVILVMVQYLEYTNDGRLRFPSYKGSV